MRKQIKKKNTDKEEKYRQKRYTMNLVKLDNKGDR